MSDPPAILSIPATRKKEIMDYNYVLTIHYDGNYRSSYRFSDAISAVEEFQKCVDYGFANEVATYNLLEPNGKMHTRNFFTNGKVTGK